MLQALSLLGEMRIFKVLHKCYTSSKVQHVVSKGVAWATFAASPGVQSRDPKLYRTSQQTLMRQKFATNLDASRTEFANSVTCDAGVKRVCACVRLDPLHPLHALQGPSLLGEMRIGTCYRPVTTRYKNG